MNLYFRALISVATILLIGIGTFLMVREILVQGEEIKEQPCEKFGNVPLNNMPGRCYRYFTDKDK